MAVADPSPEPTRAWDGRWSILIGFAVLAAVALWLHVNAGYTYPRPWPDESHFITPALTLAREGRLAVPELNAPRGIFWVPSGYYVAQVPLVLVGVDPLVAGRLLSLIGVLAFAGGLVAAVRSAGLSAAVALTAVAIWVCMPRVVALGNIARMEGVVLGIAGVCLALTARDRWPLAVAVSLLAPLVHPVGLIVAAAVVGAAILRGGRRPWSRVERIALLVVGVLWVVQIGYVAASAGVAAEHLRFQLTRKAGRPITWQWWQWTLLIVIAVGGAFATWRWRRRAPGTTVVWIALAMAGGFVLVDVVGREMWYEALGRETVILLAGLAGAAALARFAPADMTRDVSVAVSVVLGVAAAVALQSALAGGWYSMRPDAGSRSEWRTFTQTAVGELQQLDASATQPATVVVDPLSGFGQEIFAQRFEHLRFVQPTPATPMDTLAADYVLVTPGAPFTTKSLTTQWGAVQPALEVTSTQGTYTLQLLANPAGG